LPWIEQRIGIELAPSQNAAVRLALASKVLVITGGPGVGKTTIVNSILRILAAKTVKLLLCDQSYFTVDSFVLVMFFWLPRREPP
jgi:exodeoxyribonuclease V alpha subunit